MRCPECRRENAPGRALCIVCGARLQAPKVCTGCGKENAAARRRCLYCSEPLKETAAKTGSARSCPGCGRVVAPHLSACQMCGAAMEAIAPPPAPRSSGAVPPRDRPAAMGRTPLAGGARGTGRPGTLPPAGGRRPGTGRSGPPRDASERALSRAPRRSFAGGGGFGSGGGLPDGKMVKNIACLTVAVAVMLFCGFGNLLTRMFGITPSSDDDRPGAMLTVQTFNSTDEVLRIEIHSLSKGVGSPPESSLTLNPGQGQAVVIWKADSLDFKVVHPPGRTYYNEELHVLPDQKGDVILDFGGDGTFHRMAIAYTPLYWGDIQRKQWLAENPLPEMDTYSGASRHLVTGDIDFNLGVKPPERLDEGLDQPFIRWKLASEGEMVQSFLEQFR